MSKMMCKSVTTEMYFAFKPVLLSLLRLCRAESYRGFSSGRSLRTFPAFHFFTHYVGYNTGFWEKRVFAISKPPICANLSVENCFSEKSGTRLSKTFTSNIFENTSFLIINYLKGVGLNGQSSNPT